MNVWDNIDRIPPEDEPVSFTFAHVTNTIRTIVVDAVSGNSISTTLINGTTLSGPLFRLKSRQRSSKE
jgi:hypothetical protein